jgi:hypothetical protein
MLTGKENLIIVIYKNTISSNIGGEFQILLNGVLNQYNYINLPMTNYVYVDFSGRIDPNIVIKAIKNLPSASKYIKNIVYTKTLKSVMF